MYIARGMLTDFPWKNDYYLSDWLGGEAQVLDAMIGPGGPVDRLCNYPLLEPTMIW